jgi:hypothetical protein
LLNTGFGEKRNDELEKNIKSGKKEFTLETTQEYSKQNVDQGCLAIFLKPLKYKQTPCLK